MSTLPDELAPLEKRLAELSEQQKRMGEAIDRAQQSQLQGSLTVGKLAETWQTCWDSKDQAFARLAFIFLVVQVAGGLVLIAFYYNLAAFEVYILALFWAMIVSIPLYQVKISIIELIFSQLLRESYEVVALEGERRVKVRKLSRFFWLHVGNEVETAFLSKERMSEMAAGKEYHVTIHRSKRGRQVQQIWERRHWLGTFRPCNSTGDLFRLNLKGAFKASWHFLVKPINQFSTATDSTPYFGLLLRLCFLQLCSTDLGKEICMLLLRYSFYAYICLVCVRFVATILSQLVAPFLAVKLGPGQMDKLRRCWGGIASWLLRFQHDTSQWLNKPWDALVAAFKENCHVLLSLLIVVATLASLGYFISFLMVALRREAILIGSACHKLMQSHEAYHMAMEHLEQLQKEQNGGLLGHLRAQLENALPDDYEKVLARYIPDFYILKYVAYDIWNQDHGSHSEAQQCAGGAACGREDPDAVVMKHALKNTTAVIHALTGRDRNLTEISSLLMGAYAEIAAVSSLLGDGASQSTADAFKGGAAYGGSLLAWFTYSVPRALLDAVSSASCVLGQTVVFVTALFYLLSAQHPCLVVVGEFLKVVDHNQVIFRLSEKVMRAVLVSAMKMSTFHALFTWFLYSFGQLPIVVVPTVLSAVLALVPKVSPVWSVSFWATVYLWMVHQKVWAVVYLILDIAVWWQVPTVIYAEIPESNAWLTGLGVVLGVGQFGLAGVVLGPLLATVPLICFNLVKLFNDQWKEEEGDEVPQPEDAKPRPTLFNLWQRERSYTMTEGQTSGSEEWEGSSPTSPHRYQEPTFTPANIAPESGSPTGLRNRNRKTK